MRCLIVTLWLVLLMPDPIPAWRSDIVRTWARDLGDELWRLSEALTKSDQIRIKYKQMNASVKKKNGAQILESSLQSVSTMLNRKINAVKCIHAKAEELASEFNYSQINQEFMDNFSYCSAKYSHFEYEEGVEPLKPKYPIPRFANDNHHHMNMTLERDSHFYDISVNTNASCVQVPTNIYYLEPDPFNAIVWSKGLTEVFIKNYQSDPSLSWQYFGSSRGILRFYPGMPWNRMEQADIYDCRVKSWYIEAATCSKDVIVLFDVSGSMTGFKNYVARRTLKSLLSTLSNNDYVNVYTFKNVTEPVVKCFEGLVQATPENIKTIEETLTPVEVDKVLVHKVPLEGNANLSRAYMQAFLTLKQRRLDKECDVVATQGCNQLVMVITDYVPGNLTEVFEEYNREVVNNKTYIPVRVFTFLIGKEVTNVREIQWMACLNRGYFVHIHSVEEVQQQVLKYINVIARPMILDGSPPPPTWTHANIDYTRTNRWNVSSDVENPDEDKLVTSVAIPAFDYRYNEEHNDAILLGVAGTDVPIDSIAKLAQPHQLGVNGYPLIVSNNGYLLLHPLLIATINSKMQDNFNSVDFVEVEQVDDGKGPRELGDKIKKLRQHLVNADTDNMTEVEVLFHYDDMRRIARVQHDYFFSELKGTPFSMGISLPRGYGDTELMLKDNPLEAKQGKELTGINVTDYFRSSFRVHPDWVYCKYHYLEGHEATTPEIEMWRFLVLISKNQLNITKQQYTQDSKDEIFDVNKHCGEERKLLGKDDYYCTEDLVKQLVFDAKLTTPYFKEWHATNSEWELAKKYNISVRFIATSSGLTRWHYIFDDDKNEYVNDDGTREKKYGDKVFGDFYSKAIEETWYKAAVLQHMINKESLVIATRLPNLDETIKTRPPVENPDGDITVTASYAIFYKDGDSETPASVVGFQYSYSKFHERFVELTKAAPTGDKPFSCGENYDCYVVDSSGYVVLSVPYDTSQVGQFFGVVNKDTKLVMQFLIEKNIFTHVEVFNYQALCPISKLQHHSSSWSMPTPFSIAGNFIRWLFSEFVLLIMNWNQYSYANDDVADYSDIDYGNLEPATTAAPEANETVTAKEEEEETFSCDHSITLYILNQKLMENMGLPRTIHSDKEGDCHPPFWASFVPKTNLLLVAVERGEWDYDGGCPEPVDTTPRATDQSTTSREPCHKLPLGRLPQRKLEGCYTYNEKERNITACGIGSVTRADVLLFMSAALLGALAPRLFSQ